MKTKELVPLLAFFLLMGGSSGARKIPAGAPILIVGDSQSLPGGFGDRLAAELRRAGYTVSVLAVGGKTGGYFTTGEGKQKLLAQLAALRPQVVLCLFGTNEAADIALSPSTEKSIIKGHLALKQLLNSAGARALFVGPPDFSPGVKGGGKDPAQIIDAFPVLVPRLRAVYGEENFLDARPYTPMPHTQIHFGAKQAHAFAESLAPAVLEALP